MSDKVFDPDRYFCLGIDGGGTGCRARIVKADNGEVLGEGTGGPATLRLGADAAWLAMMKAADAAMTAAGIDPANDCVSVGVGVAGLGRNGAWTSFPAATHSFALVQVTSDQVTAYLGAHGGLDGGIVIAGTGSAAYGRVAGREVRAGGYGFPVSDEGSGAWLGLEALRMALRAHDGRRAETPLLRAVMARFQGDPYRVVEWMEHASATEYATLAPLVAEAAHYGDAAASELMRHAALSICGLVTALFAQGVPRVSLIGGLAPAMEAWLPDEIRRQLSAPEGDSVDGAIRFVRYGVKA